MKLANGNYETREEAVEAFFAENDGQVVEFEGQNCDELDDNVCDGWFVSQLPGNRRCECGNRRVYVDTYGDEKIGYFGVAVAD